MRTHLAKPTGPAQQLERLKAGTPVRLVTDDQRTIKGKVETLVDGYLTLKTARGQSSLSVAAITDVDVVSARDAGFLPFVDLPQSLDGMGMRLIEGNRLKLATKGGLDEVEYRIERVNPRSGAVTLEAVDGGSTRKVAAKALEFATAEDLSLSQLRKGSWVHLSLKDGSMVRGVLQLAPTGEADERLLVLGTQGATARYTRPAVAEVERVQKVVLREVTSS